MNQINGILRLFGCKDISKYNIFKLLRCNDLKTTFYCTTCGAKKSTICENCKSERNANNVFVAFDIKDMLHGLLSKKSIQNKLVFQPNVSIDGTIRDVFDGEQYKGINKGSNDVSFSFNTDGCQAWNSSKTSVWPLYIAVNELLPEVRFKNILLVGLWVGKKHPDMNVFLKPFVDQCNTLKRKGFSWIYKGVEIKSRAHVTFCTVDSCARHILLNMKKFNGIPKFFSIF